MKKPFSQLLCAVVAAMLTACASASTPAGEPVNGPAEESVVRGPVKPGNHRQIISTADGPRPYLLHVPPGYDGSAALPLVLVLHGFGGNAGGMARLIGMDSIADQQNFFVAYLNGTEGVDAEKGISGLAWNSGLTPQLNLNVDDIAFVTNLVDQLSMQLEVDRSRVYAVGFSNGGFMTHRLAAERPDMLAAVAVVASAIGLAPPGESYITVPDPAAPIAVLIIHGVQDTHILYEGGQASEGVGRLNAQSVSDGVAFWTEANGCSPAPAIETSADQNVITEEYGNCDAGSEVKLITIVNGGHEWPTAQGHTRFSATDAIWEFFSRRIE